jgi:hypothetical protein
LGSKSPLKKSKVKKGEEEEVGISSCDEVSDQEEEEETDGMHVLKDEHHVVVDNIAVIYKSLDI